MKINAKPGPNPSLLSAGIKMSKTNAAKARSTVQAALAGEVIMVNANNAYIRHDTNYALPLGNSLNETKAANFYLMRQFVDQLKNTNDTRLSLISIRY